MDAAIWTSRVEDEGGPRVRRAVEYGRAGRAQVGGQAVRRVVARVPVEDRRAVAEEGTGAVLHRAGVASTLHGFRSSARSWMAESGVPAEVAEACLAHVPRSQVVQAYQRSDLLARRAQVLQAWSDYIL